MNIVFSHTTALNLYRYFRAETGTIKIKQCPTNFILPDKAKQASLAYSKLQFDNFIEANNSEILISNINKKHKMKGAEIRTSNLVFPKNSFYSIGDKTYLPCLELVFYQLSQKFDFASLLLAGMEMCGRYTFSDIFQRSFISNVSFLTNKNKLLQYLYQLKKLNKHCNSVNYACKAAAQIGDNSWSPAESQLYIMLCGNRSIGAYGIKNMMLNYKIKLSDYSSDMIQQNYVVPDICNPITKIAIEYDSTSFHEAVSQNQKDKLRMNALHHDG